MINDYEAEAEKLYVSLKDKISEENDYLKNNKRVDEKYLSEVVMQKRVLTDKIEKRVAAEKLSNVSKLRIQAIVKNMMEIEEENRKLYNEKMDGIKKEISNLHNEKKLNKKYKNDNSGSLFFDKKK